jgi:hypothetical protein
MKREVKGTVRYEERGQGYRDAEKVGKHCPNVSKFTKRYGGGCRATIDAFHLLIYVRALYYLADPGGLVA